MEEIKLPVMFSHTLQIHNHTHWKIIDHANMFVALAASKKKCDQIVSALNAGYCATCGGSGSIQNPNYEPPRFLDEGESYTVPCSIPCPDCPKEGELVKELREKYTVAPSLESVSERCMREEILELATTLSEQAKRIGELEKGRFLDEVTQAKASIGLQWARQRRKLMRLQKGSVDTAIEDALAALQVKAALGKDQQALKEQKK